MPRCFVIQPFDDGPYDKRYRDVLVPAIEKAGLEPYRVDEDPRTTIPIDEIENGIKRSDICLADVTADNPNVWYEVGYALANSKPVVLICMNRRPTPFPFDVRHRHVITYSLDSPRDFLLLGNEISSRLMAQLNKPIDARSSQNELIDALSREVAKLRTDVNEIVGAITTTSKSKPDNTWQKAEGLQGIWESSSGDIFCARIFEGEMLAPYVYHSEEEYVFDDVDTHEPMGHMYGCRILDETLFGRFAWFGAYVSGVIVLKIVSATCLRGSWWYAADAPRDLLEGKLENQSEGLGRANELVLEKKGSVSQFPAWATRYFTNPQHYLAAAESIARAAATLDPPNLSFSG